MEGSCKLMHRCGVLSVGIAMEAWAVMPLSRTPGHGLQDDQPSKIPMAIHIGKQTKKLFAKYPPSFFVKVIVLIEGGLAL
ncbi:MAG: hypothetical protein IPL95_15525 [Saprospiraceae bacterium]|nr:hypothetical protein [Saprospiraceae bacterium]